jgi:hypothetical protein
MKLLCILKWHILVFRSLNPPNDVSIIRGLSSPSSFINPLKNSLKKSIVYSTWGLSLYSKPMIYGITSLKNLYKVGATSNIFKLKPLNHAKESELYDLLDDE